MKKFVYFLLPLLFFTTAYSQVLYTENFDNHSIGNLGTDVTGKIPGQWGWFTKSFITQTNGIFTIVNETGRGKVLDITGPLSQSESLRATKKNLKQFITNRSVGNNVLLFEIDYQTGSKQISNTTGNGSEISIGYINPLNPDDIESLTGILFEKTSGSVEGYLKDGKAALFGDNQNNHYYLPFNTWVKINIYLDYPNRKGYFYLPVLNKVFVDDFFISNASTNLIQDFPPDALQLHASSISGESQSLTYTRNRYDNIKITALKNVPPEVIALSTNEQLAAKFNMYPNPATNIVNITNAENMLVNQVTVYDVTGKQLSTQSFNSETQIQLNVENLASGTYMLHLQTNEGTAVKKLVKN